MRKNHLTRCNISNNKNSQQTRNRKGTSLISHRAPRKIKCTASIMLNIKRQLSMKKKCKVGQLYHLTLRVTFKLE